MSLAPRSVSLAPRSAGARSAIAAALIGLAVVAGGCGIAARQGDLATTPAVLAGPTSTAGPVVAAVRSQLAAALSARSLILTDAKVPFRPGEPAELISVARTVHQVQLRDDPTGGFIVVYELPGIDAAIVAGLALATYLSSGPGRVQVPSGTVHVLRRVGSVLIYYRWLPDGAIDPATPGIQAALETVGLGITVAR